MDSTKYIHTADMGEISGFGGGYEETCQKMLSAGVTWLKEHPELAPQFHSYSGIYGVCVEDNAVAKQLSKAVAGAAEPYGATGAMHQAVIQRVMVIRKNGWDWYCAECRKHEAAEASSVANGNQKV